MEGGSIGDKIYFGPISSVSMQFLAEMLSNITSNHKQTTANSCECCSFSEQISTLRYKMLDC